MDFSESEEEQSQDKYKCYGYKYRNSRIKEEGLHPSSEKCEFKQDGLLNSLSFKNRKLEGDLHSLREQVDLLTRGMQQRQAEVERLQAEGKQKDEALLIKDN